MEIVWDALDETGWNAALPPEAAALQQSWRYGAVAQALGRRVHRGAVFVDGLCCALVQVLCRDFGLFSHLGLLLRAPIWLVEPDATLRRAVLVRVRAELPGLGLTLLLATPEEDSPDLLPLMTAATVAELNLAPDPGAMRHLMRGKWRNRLVRAETAGLRVDQTTPQAADLVWLIALEQAQQRTQGYRALPPAFLTAWTGAGQGGIRLFSAFQGSRPVAAMLFLDHAPGATYQIGWTGAAGRETGAHNLLLWHAMCHFAGAGRRRLDLGPLDTVSAPGLARFKLGAGATARGLGRTGLVLPRVGRGLPVRQTNPAR